MLNLVVVDVETFAEDVFKSYYYELTHTYGYEVSDKDARGLLLYYTLKHIINILETNEDRKNVIFYTNTHKHIELRFIKTFEKICKVFPVLNYTNTLDFNCLQRRDGCYEELSTCIKEYRFNFDFNKFSQRKMKAFLEKYKLKISFPA